VTARNLGARTGLRVTSPASAHHGSSGPGGDDAPEFVDVDITPGIAVYWDGEQCSGTVEHVPYGLAMYWMRRRWAMSLTFAYS